MREDFKKDVEEGLSRDEKRLYSKYFYDEKGDQLFIDIMGIPEYYLTRAEYSIFEKKSDEIINKLRIEPGKYFELIELGAGDGTKTKLLLKSLVERGFQFSYNPIDISKHALENLKQSLGIEIPSLHVRPQTGDYFEILDSLNKSSFPKILLFLGSNIGNMYDNEAMDFVQKLSNNTAPGDRLLLGVDLIKSKSIILPAYNDKNGYTAAFNLNLLHRINRELGGNFEVEFFEHAPEYDENLGAAFSYLKSLKDQEVKIKSLGKSFQFKKGEKIFMEISRKYSDEVIGKIFKNTDFKVIDKILDDQEYFADYILIKESYGIY